MQVYTNNGIPFQVVNKNFWAHPGFMCHVTLKVHDWNKVKSLNLYFSLKKFTKFGNLVFLENIMKMKKSTIGCAFNTDV